MKTITDIYNERVKEDPGRTMLTVVGSRLDSVSYDLAALDEKASQAAGCLKSSGCEKGDRVLISLRETVPLWAFFWGTLKLGAVPCILFPELGAGALEVRLRAAEACFLVTDADPAKLQKEITFPKTLKNIILLGKPSEGPEFVVFQNKELVSLKISVEVSPDDDAFIIFTSGTTGIPKPVVHRHGIAEAIVRSMHDVLHAKSDDVYWCTAHPAWITGTVYGILGPILCGIHSIQYEGKFHSKRWMPILQDQRISLWYTAPTALRGLMREDEDFFKNYDFSSVKQIYSIGEPLSEQVFSWGQKTFGKPIIDTWFQTECGTVRIAGNPSRKIRPGWIGTAVDDSEVKITQEGRLYLKAGFGSMFKEYYGMPEETDKKLEDGWYRTGDLASISDDGYIRFEGREDDVINTSGHLISPLEVEQVLTTHPEIEAAAVVSEPDELLYEVPAAYIVLAEGTEWDRTLETRLKVAVNTRVSPYAVPKHFYIVNALPLTSSGKINRAALRTTSH